MGLFTKKDLTKEWKNFFSDTNQDDESPLVEKLFVDALHNKKLLNSFLVELVKDDHVYEISFLYLKNLVEGFAEENEDDSDAPDRWPPSIPVGEPLFKFLSLQTYFGLTMNEVIFDSGIVGFGSPPEVWDEISEKIVIPLMKKYLKEILLAGKFGDEEYEKNCKDKIGVDTIEAIEQLYLDRHTSGDKS